MSTHDGPVREEITGAGAGREQLLHYWRVLVHRRWVIATCAVVVLAVTLVLTLFATPVYEATISLQIDRKAPEVLAFQDVMRLDPSYAAYQDFYETQYRILRSRRVLRLAAERLDLINRPEYAGRTVPPIHRLIGWVRSLGGGGGDEHEEVAPIDLAVNFLQGGLSISPVRNSHLVNVSFADSSPDLARDVANAIADAYLQFSFQTRYDTTAVAREFLTKEVARVRAEIGELEQQLQDYAGSKEILSLDDGAGDISRQALSALNARYGEARGRLVEAQANWEAVRDAEPSSFPEVLDSPLIRNLKQDYAEVERRYSQMAESFREEWPPLKALAEELEQARRRLELETEAIAGQVREVAEAEYRRAEAEVRHLAGQLAEQKREVQRVNRDAIEYASLKAEIDTKRELLDELVSRQSETQTTERLKDTGTSNIRVVDRAETPRFPVRPNKKLNVLLALVLGGGLGVAMAFLLDYLDNTIKSESDVERIAAFPVLGHVPHYQPLRVVEGQEDVPLEPLAARTDLASHRESRSGFSEAFRNLRTAILLASPDRPPRQIVVTSCEPEDGKSTVATNLAVVLTQMGRKVLLVDADLRKPRLHKIFGFDNGAGLSSVLSGNAEPSEVVRATELPDLAVVPSGPIPPNPSELLGSNGLAAFFEFMIREGGFEHVILDSPPVVSVTDPVLLAAASDATIVVIRQGKTVRESLGHAAERLRKARVRVAGAVLNAVVDESGRYYYSRHHYYLRDEGGDARPQSPLKRPFRRPSRRHDRSTGGA